MRFDVSTYVSTYVSTWLAAALLFCGLLACSAEPPSEQQALVACQEIALTKIDSGVTPRYRQHKTQIETLQAGPENYAFSVKGEYFYKGIYSGDSELKFDCSVSKTPEAESWTTVSFDSRCIGGC